MKKKSKIAIVYASSHHMNTKKIVDAIKDRFDVDTYTVSECVGVDFSKYDYIGYASGIYYGMFNKGVIKVLENTEFKESQKVFLIYTCGVDYKNHAKCMETILKKKDAEYVGKFKCSGYDTFGILKYIGGVNKNHPSKYDIIDAIDFMKNIIDEK